MMTTACRTAETVPDAPPATFATPADATNAFGLDLFGQLSDLDENIVYSPLSISTALAMTSAGARGETAREILDALRVDDEAGPIHHKFGQLIADLQQEDQQTLLVLANSLWVQRDRAYGIDFLEILEEDYRSEMRQVDFEQNPEEAREVINQWVEERTRELIPEILPRGSVGSLTRLVLVNALYLKAGWQSPFSKESTSEEDFTLPGGTTVQVPMMRQQSELRYLRTDDVKAVELPFDDSSLSMVAVSPEEISPAEFLGQLTPTRLNELFEEMEIGEVRLGLPRFEMNYPIQLRDMLQEMGILLAFDAEVADFAPITRDEPLEIADVYHDSTISVDESGVEASAATAVVMRTISAPAQPPEIVPITFDEPFAFFIRDRDSGAILFIGQVVDPR